MHYIKSLLLMEKYADCPKCGNSSVGSGEGKLIVEDDTFYRECKCGWNIKTDEDGNVL